MKNKERSLSEAIPPEPTTELDEPERRILMEKAQLHADKLFIAGLGLLPAIVSPPGEFKTGLTIVCSFEAVRHIILYLRDNKKAHQPTAPEEHPPSESSQPIEQ